MSAPAAPAAPPRPRREDQPDGSVKIVFAAPILYHAEARGHLTLRRPQAGEVWDLGDPVTWFVSDSGLAVRQIERPALREWVKRLIVDHDADVIAMLGDVALGLLIEDAVVDFFQSARTLLRQPPAP